MSKNSSADSYAKALFLLPAEENQQLQRLEGLEQIQKRMKSYPKLKALLEAPDLFREERQKLVKTLLISHEDPLMINFINMLIEKNRLGCLSEITRIYRLMIHQKHGIQAVKAISSAPLEGEAVEALIKKLQMKYPNKKIELTQEIDPSVLGGLALVIDNQIIDGTIKGQLAKLNQHLLALPI